jgi:MarR family transcriptional repressor of emrRAB
LTTTFDTGANRLGALALRLADRLDIATCGASDGSASTAAALSAIYHFLDDPSIDQLSQVLGLSSSATVRVVDRLAAKDLVTRKTAGDRRVSVVRLTAAGRRRAKQTSDARAAVLSQALGALTPRERDVFDRLVDKVLIGLVQGSTGHGWMCRLCDTQTCGANPGQPCPITVAAMG